MNAKNHPINLKKIALEYINGELEGLPNMREKLETLISKSHILDKRKQVIHTMLSHFEKKDYISFVSMVPLQIEGIFEDICRELGASESELGISSLNKKLEIIDEKINSLLSFEYYSFIFPVLRNLVAHGGLVGGDLEETAIKLMLDLYPVCLLADSNDLPINRAIQVLKLANQKDFQNLIEWLDLKDKVSIPEFYNMEEDIKSAELHYSSQEFWDYLTKELEMLNHEDELKRSVPVKVAGKLKNKGFDEEQCKKFLQNSTTVLNQSIETRRKSLEEWSKALKTSD
ncbi:MAG: hypothetical protein GPJ14_08430 [Microcystis aeruginosa G11-01]|nr:hypothetical protein [Microcystis aeruginosa G11-01]